MIINKEKLQGCKQGIFDLAVFLEDKYSNIIITSGYRSPEYNAKIGGSENSRHLTGEAIDVIVKDVSPIKVAAYVLNSFPKVNGIGLDVYQGYCHLDIREQKNKTYWVYDRKGRYI